MSLAAPHSLIELHARISVEITDRLVMGQHVREVARLVRKISLIDIE